MPPIWTLRLVCFVIVAVVGGISLANLMAEVLRDGMLTLPLTSDLAATADQLASAKRAARFAPFRSDLRSEFALAQAGQAIKYDGQPQLNELARNAVKGALKFGPHDPNMWLTLALLQTRSKVRDPLIAES